MHSYLAIKQTRSLLLILLLATHSAFAEETEAKAQRKKKAAREKKQEEEKVIKEQFGYSFNDIRDNLVVVEHDDAVGSGFIAKMDDKFYILTNQHVILGADKIRFTTASGKPLRPRKVELSTTRDIARLLLDSDAGFEITDNIEMDAPIGVFGNSDGGGVATELYGKITGVGGELVEVSADFVSGNSGSPVLNLEQEVIGIASYVRYSDNSKMKEGTRFENQTRRFCYRLTDVQWKAVNWKKYNDKYGKLYKENEILIDSIFEIANLWYEDPFSKVTADEHPDMGLRKWSTSHNHMVNRIVRMRDKGRATPHQLDNTNKQIRKDLGDSAEDLSTVCRGRARQMRLLAAQRELTDFLHKEFEGFAYRLDYAAKQIERYGDKLSAFNFFHFAEDD
jgi:hypothetical protein